MKKFFEKSGHRTCAAKSCKNKYYNSKKSFFTFPTDLNRATIWARASNREDLIEKLGGNPRNYALCCDHFEPKMFTNHYCKRLKHNAIPSLFHLLEGISSSEVPSDHLYAQPPLHLMEIPCTTLQVLRDTTVVPARVADTYKTHTSTVQLDMLVSPTSSSLDCQAEGERDLQGEDDSFKKLNEELINDIKELRIHPENKPNPLFYEKLQDLIFKICPTPEIAEFIGEQISRAQNMLKGNSMDITSKFTKQCNVSTQTECLEEHGRKQDNVSDSKQALPLVEPKPQRGGSYQDDHFIDAIVKREDDFDQLMDIETPLESSSKQEDLHLDEKIEICKEELLDSDKDNYNIPLNKKIITENNGEPCRTYEDPADELTSYHSLENNLVQKVLHTPVVTLDCSGNTDRFFQSLSSLAKTLNPLDQVILQSNVANMVFGMKIAHLTKNSSVNT